MMQPADLRDCSDSTAVGRFDSAQDRCIPIKGKMRPRLVIIGEIQAKDAHQVSLVEHDDVIQTLSPNRPNETFAIRIGLRRQLHPMVPIRRDFFRSPIPSIH